MRDFLDLLDELPEDGRFARATGPEGRLWTEWHELAYSLIETVSVAASHDTRFKKPLDLTRPRYPDLTAKGPASEPEEIAAFFGLVYLPAAQEDPTP